MYVDLDGGTRTARTGARGSAATVHRVSKKAAGRLLDGRTWDEMPGQAAEAAKEQHNEP
jgi:protein gp37